MIGIDVRLIIAQCDAILISLVGLLIESILAGYLLFKRKRGKLKKENRMGENIRRYREEERGTLSLVREKKGG